MTAKRVTIAGGCGRAVALAGALARRGCAVWLLEPDPDDAARLADAVARRGAAAGVVTRTLVAGMDMVLVTRGAAAGLAEVLDQGGTLLRLLPEGESPAAGETAADLAGPADAPAFVEHWAGPDLPASRLAQALGVPRVTVPGPVTQTLVATIEDAAEALVFAGATPWELDEAMEAAGWAQGPCLMQDARGLDAAFARHRAQDASGARRHPVPLIDRMVPEGRLGRKGGVGWYRYPGGGGAVIDPLVQDLALEEAHFARATPRDPDPATMLAGTEAALARWARGMAERGVDGAIMARAAQALGLPAGLMQRLLAIEPAALRSWLDDLARALHPYWTP